jgi:hypothetical protein
MTLYKCKRKINRNYSAILATLTEQDVIDQFQILKTNKPPGPDNFLSSGMDRRSFMSAHSYVLRQDSGKKTLYISQPNRFNKDWDHQ